LWEALSSHRGTGEAGSPDLDEEAIMGSIRVVMTLMLALMLGLATSVAAQPLNRREFVNLAVYRVADSRNANGPYGGPILRGGATRNVTITGQCGVPNTATAVAFSFTVIGPVAPGHLIVMPARGAFPPVPTLNYLTGETVTTSTTVPLGQTGGIAVQALNTTHLVIDVRATSPTSRSWRATTPPWGSTPS
jgi:hypothetical protein